MVARGQHRGDLDGHGAIIEVMHGGSGTPLSVTLVGSRLKAFVQFPPLRGMY